MNLKSLWTLVKRSFSDWMEDKAPRLAAALAYYTVFSIAPLLIIVIAIAGLVFGPAEVQREVVAQVESLIGETGAAAVEGMLGSASDPESGIFAAIAGAVTLVLGASGLFGQLQDALNTIWEVAPRPDRGIWGTIQDRFLSFTMVLGVGFLLLVSLVISAALAGLERYLGGILPEAILQIVNFIISFLVIMLLFAMIYKVLPDVEIAWRDVWLGAAITSLLFTIGKLLIGLYLGHSSVASAYGAAGSLAVILIWVYYSAQILLLGAEFTQVYANLYGSGVRPDEDAVRLTEADFAQQGAPRRKAVRPGPLEPGRLRVETNPRRMLPPGRPSDVARPGQGMGLGHYVAILFGFGVGLIVGVGNRLRIERKGNNRPRA